MPPGAKLRNACRGAVVDEAALRSGALAKATLDVFDTAPLPPGHPLWAMENLLITPHLASITVPQSAASDVAESIRQIGTPEAIYRHPADSFVGDVNRLPARLATLGAETATVTSGACACALTVPAAPLAGLAPGTAVELFIRPEQLRPGTPALFLGTIVARIRQGDRVNLYLTAAGTRILVRLPGNAAQAFGTSLSIVEAADAVAYPA